jgi:hypothetical protein
MLDSLQSKAFETYSIIIDGISATATKSSIMMNYVQQQEKKTYPNNVIFQFMNPIFNPNPNIYSDNVIFQFMNPIYNPNPN